MGGCAGDDSPHIATLVLATTTSLYDSGLLDTLVPAFEAAHPAIRIRLVAVGSGHALELGRRGDADVLLVHSREEEEAFILAGHGVRRLAVMVNDFVIVGPPADPSGVRGAHDTSGALRRIAAGGTPFISRGDGSGTHRAELRLWEAAGIGQPAAVRVRVESGQGMGETLTIASERGAYTLTDRGTYLPLAAALHLMLLFEGGPEMINTYSVIATRHARSDAAAHAFADWLVSAEAANLIDGYGRDRFGRPLFLSAAAREPLIDEPLNDGQR